MERVARKLDIEPAEIERFCQKWQVTELALFGSALRDDFRTNSDVDLLVSFAKDATWSLFDLVTMEDELSALLGREVDLVERSALEHSENYIRRRHILASAEPFYVAR
ncbi:MAG TPA: nucleotidyltransferase domain-containing protein [Armatimonadota bacterium]|nr:nucleotidyltransferase domain-containing protein [Armatimonadota bacterium]